MTVQLQAAEGPRDRWRLGAYEFARYGRLQDAPGSPGWSACNTRGRGVAGYRSPLGAFLALRRWGSTPAGPVG